MGFTTESQSGIITVSSAAISACSQQEAKHIVPGQKVKGSGEENIVMKGNGPKNTLIVMWLCVLLLTVMAGGTTAFAEDQELLKRLPGQWIFTDEVQEEGEEARREDLAFLTLEEDGKTSLRCNRKNGEYAYTCEGEWSFELVPDGMDRLTLVFTSTDDPSQSGSEYSVICEYNVYSESWVENDTEHTYLIFEDGECSGLCPFEDLYESNNVALHKEKGPNMRVINCKSFVSLRKTRSTSSGRLEKVPLGALVLAFPEYGEEKGFIYCVYHDKSGYILSEYLESVEETP